MSDNTFFYGDGRLEEDPAEFLGKLVMQMGGRPEADQLRMFPHFLAVGSIAREWYNGLPAATTADITRLQEAFGKRFRALPTTGLTSEAKTLRLLDHKLNEDAVGTTVSTPRGPMPAHVVFATQMANLAAAIPDSAALIPVVESHLPYSLRQHLPGPHATFDDLADAIIALPSWRLGGSDLKLRELEERVNALSLQTPSAPQRSAWRTPAQFTRAVDRAPPSSPAAATPIPSRRPVGLGITAPHARNREQPAHISGAPNTPPATPYTGGQRAPVPAATMAEYAAKVEEWKANNPGRRPSADNPFPLTPGTAPAGTGECRRCGLRTEPVHYASSCLSTTIIPDLEQAYRMAVMRANNDRNRSTPAVRAVHFEGGEEEGEEDWELEEAEFQGNGLGAAE